MVALSRENPDRVHVLKLGAPWCKGCRIQSKALRKHAGGEDTAIGRAVWTEFNVDELPQAEVRAFLQRIGIPVQMVLPLNLVFRKGRIIGSMWGGEMRALEKFLGEAEAIDPDTGPKPDASARAIPRLPCGPRQSENVCVFGFSGPGPDADETTDDFGRANLRMFATLFKDPHFEMLFAPKAPKKGVLPSKTSEDGLLYVRNPFLHDVFESPSDARKIIDQMDYVTGTNVRLLLTGHGGPEGMSTGGSPSVFQTADLENAVTKALRAGKSVRTVGVQCYGGQFAEALMPREGTPASRACGAFASLPEKLAEGCYASTYTANRRDYLGLAAWLKKCDGSQTARDLHYKIVATPRSHDIPMLSSEYFLLYGAAASHLGRAEMAPVPPYGLLRLQLPSGAKITANMLDGEIVAASRAGKSVPVPAITGIEKPSEKEEGQRDFRNPATMRDLYNYTFLSRRPFGKRDPSQPSPSSTSTSKPFVLDTANSRVTVRWYDGTEETFSITRETFKSHPPYGANEGPVSISSYRPEVRLLLSRILPKLRNLDENGMRNLVERIQLEVWQHDAALSSAIGDLSAVLMAQARVDGKGRSFATGLEVTNALLWNHGDSSVESLAEVPLLRFAHILSAAMAELNLREEAARDPKAAKLIEQLEQLRECEKDLL